MQKKMTVMGSINVDHVLQIPYLSQLGETLKGEAYHLSYGGKGANQALAVARLKPQDYEVDFLACIGGEEIGEKIKHTLSQAGVKMDLITTINDAPTGMAFIQVLPTGENSIVVAGGANAYLDSKLVNKYAHHIAHSDCLLVQLETPLDAVKQAIYLAKNEGVFVALNPAPAQSLPDELYGYIDLITPNETEVEILTGINVFDEESAKKASDFFHQRGVRIVVITLGEKGVYVSENGEYTAMLPSFAVKAVDTTSAGDTFNGALISALLEHKSLDEAILFAQAAAAISVTRLGAQSSIPTRQEVDVFLLNQ